MNDSRLVAYGLMFLIVVGLGMAIWWSVHHSHWRTYQRRVARERKNAIAAEQVRSASGVDGRDRA